MFRRLALIVPALVLTLIACIPASAQGTGERILLYESDIVVNQDATMTVAETITVNSTGTNIIHGIYRDFPTSYTGSYGRRVKVRFDVQEVLRDGSPEDYEVKNQLGYTRVYIGNKDVTLQPGTYTYYIKYSTDRQIGFFRDHDELYWNVTGNKWQFPIDKVAARVILPGKIPADKIRLDGYTGYKGDKGKDFKAGISKYHQPYFVTTRPLQQEEGLTIVVGWPKGFVKEPTKTEKFNAFIADNAGSIFNIIGLLVLLGYFIFAWSAVGRDPQKGTIIPLYTPPDGISPAAMRYICRMGWDNKVMAAALINMAVKGYVKLEESGNVYTIRRANAPSSVLSTEEAVLAEKLLDTKDSLKLESANHMQVQDAIRSMKAVMAHKYQEPYFRTNLKHFTMGILLSAVIIVLGILSGPGWGSGTAAFMGVWLSFWTLGVAALVTQIVKGWQLALRGGKHVASRGFSAGCLTVFAIPFIVGELFGIVILAASTSILFVFTLLAIGSADFLFYHLLKAPTKEGRKVLDAIEGFKMYLSVAEGDALPAAVPAEKTVETFEKYLPFALALGVEQAWSERFADVLAQAGVAGHPYSPSWYRGSYTGVSDFTATTSSLGDVMAGAVSSASAAPGSSSGFGGGGSSGGGGGGGGGGGW